VPSSVVVRPGSCLGSKRVAQPDLALSREADRLLHDALGFTRRVETRRVLSLDEIRVELRPALELAGRGALCIGRALVPGTLDLADQRDEPSIAGCAS
jgi:hypothetical protein